MIENKYKSALASILDTSPESIFLYWKGRTALYAILKAMGVKQNDEIILPGFTCVVVPNAILYLGAKPVYVDIDEENYNVDLEKLKSSITDKTKVIICQNTFGLSSNVDKIAELAKTKGIFTVEDCTHGFSGFYNGKPNGSYCDAAFFSTQWNKPFSTGIGGFSLVNNHILLKNFQEIEKDKIKPDLGDRTVLSFLIFFRNYFINNFTQQRLVKLFRFLSANNLIIGSNQGNELTNISMPEEYFKDITQVQMKAGIKKLNDLTEINKIRKKNALKYTRFLKTYKKKYVSENEFENHLFLKYPLLVNDRELFFKMAKKNGVVLGDWFVSPLHPVEENLQLWEFNCELCPIASRISKQIVNLPTEIKYVNKVLRFLDQFLDEII